ncbi:hypothetical protein [Haloarcula salina]|nr:hypothetical protein [Haloarcula salina]
MVTNSDDDATPERPKFRGCVFCYGAEWAYYGAKTAARSVSSDGE